VSPLPLGRDRLVTIKRNTAYLVEPASAGTTMTIDRQPIIGSVLAVTVAGTTPTGTVDVTGTAEGVGTMTEALAFTQAIRRLTERRYTALATVMCTGLTGCTVAVEAVGRDGAPQTRGYNLVTGLASVGYQRRQGAWAADDQGSRVIERYVFAIDHSEVFRPRPGDVVVEEETDAEWRVEQVRPQPAGHAPRHWELLVARIG